MVNFLRDILREGKGLWGLDNRLTIHSLTVIKYVFLWTFPLVPQTSPPPLGQEGKRIIYNGDNTTYSNCRCFYITIILLILSKTKRPNISVHTIKGSQIFLRSKGIHFSLHIHERSSKIKNETTLCVQSAFYLSYIKYLVSNLYKYLF